MADATNMTGFESVAPADVRAAVARICDHAAFGGAKPQQDLLRFVVEQTLTARGDDVTVETIAEVVYEQPGTPEIDGFVVTQVLQLRAHLEEYYRDVGTRDPLRLDIGAEHFDLQVSVMDPQEVSLSKVLWRKARRNWALVGAIVLAVGLVVTLRVVEGDPLSQLAAELEGQQGAENTEALNGLPDTAGMDAQEIVELGIPLMFPFINFDAQKRATALFRQAIEKEPLYARGYASATHGLVNSAMSNLGSGHSSRYLQQAKAMLDTAQDLAPDDPRVISAAAWYQFGSGDRGAAWVGVQRAFARAPTDPFIAIQYGFIGFSSGAFEAVRSASDPGQYTAEGPLKDNVLYGLRINFAAASFFTKDYQDVIRTLETERAEGRAMTVFGLAFLAAAYQASGDAVAAQREVKALQQTYPNLHPNLLTDSFFTDQPSLADPFIAALAAAGWEFLD